MVRNLALLRRENVVVTPHIAFNSIEASERILLTTIQNVQAFEAGKPANVVVPAINSEYGQADVST